MTAAPIGRLHHVIADCSDPHEVAQFWSTLLGLPITYSDPDFVVVSVSQQMSGIAFQRSPAHRPPTFPDPRGSQQLHWDVMVDDVAVASEAVLALGASALVGTVFTDPAGHPFCLVPRPGWAPPVGPG